MGMVMFSWPVDVEGAKWPYTRGLLRVRVLPEAAVMVATSDCRGSKSVDATTTCRSTHDESSSYWAYTPMAYASPESCNATDG